VKSLLEGWILWIEANPTKSGVRREAGVVAWILFCRPCDSCFFLGERDDSKTKFLCEIVDFSL